MKKGLFILLCLLIILSGCKPKTVPKQYGNLTLTILSEGMTAQTIEPELDMDIAVYDVYGVGPDGASFQKFGLTSTTVTVESLEVGNWAVTVEAKNIGGTTIGDGSTQAVIIAGQTVSREITVKPLMGNGTLRVNLSWTPGLLANPTVEANLVSLGGTLCPLTFSLGAEGDSAYYENTQLTAGYYTLVLQLMDGNTLAWGAIKVVRILAGQISVGNIHIELEGDAEIIINPELENPIEITFSGQRAELVQGTNMTVTAETSMPVDTYQWYLNGNLLAGETGESITIGQELSRGKYRLDLLVAKDDIYSSNHINFTVFPYGNIGILTGVVKDAVLGSPIQGARVRVFTGQDSLAASCLTESDGSYSLEIPAGNDYLVEFCKEGYLTANYYNVAVTADIITYLEAVLQIEEQYAGTGTVSGTITNALDGTGISNLTIRLRAGINVKTGTVVATTTTDGGGSYSITGLDAGNYTAEASGTGYVTGFFTIICIGGQETGNQNFSLTPVMGVGETRIVLTWGEYPRDLDSHLTGPRVSEEGRFHVYYGRKSYSHDQIDYADLDWDDVTSYGPETITIRQEVPGLYRYSVHDYTNRLQSYSYNLANSGAKVEVYREDTLVANFYVPNEEGTLWTVFTMEGGIITPVNTMSYESSPFSIQSLVKDGTTDVDLFINLPEKR